MLALQPMRSVCHRGKREKSWSVPYNKTDAVLGWILCGAFVCTLRYVKFVTFPMLTFQLSPCGRVTHASCVTWFISEQLPAKQNWHNFGLSPSKWMFFHVSLLHQYHNLDFPRSSQTRSFSKWYYSYTVRSSSSKIYAKYGNVLGDGELRLLISLVSCQILKLSLKFS